MAAESPRQTAQFSPSLESYIASVVAVGGEWPARVQNLRNTYPNNETAFRSALEKQVFAAHEQAKAGSTAQQQQQQHQYQQQHVQATGRAQPSPGPSQDPQSKAFAGGRSYPGQQHAPAPPTPSVNAAPQQQHGPAYIPYARDTAVRDSGPARPLTAGPRRILQASAREGSQAGPSTPTTSAALANSAARSVQHQRTNSTLNPSANFRAPRVLALPATNSRDPLPPYLPISTAQAYLTSYPSRLKLGLTSLMQPITSAGKVMSVNPRAINATTSRAAQADSSASNVLGKRQRSKIDYTERRIQREEPTSSENESSSEEDVQQEDTKLSRTQRLARRQGGTVPDGSSASTPRDSPAPDSLPKKKHKEKPKADVGGGGRTWLGQEPPGHLIMVQPARRHILPFIPERDLEAKAYTKTLLVPIRVDIDTDTHRIRDSFMWNPNESFITPDIFAQIFCLDLDIPTDPYSGRIALLIKQQLEELSGVAELSLLAPEQEAAGHEADLRTIVNIDVQVGTLHLIDRVEWDLTSPLTPEAFAAQMCADLGLGGEAIMIIAHAVHEELLRLKKDCIENGLIGYGANEGPSSKGAKKLESIWRDWIEAQAFVPHVEILTPEDIDNVEFSKENNGRRLFSKRNQDSNKANAPAGRDRGNRRR